MFEFYLLTYPEQLKHHEKLTNDKVASTGKIMCNENFHPNSRTENLQQMIKNHSNICNFGKNHQLKNCAFFVCPIGEA